MIRVFVILVWALPNLKNKRQSSYNEKFQNLDFRIKSLGSPKIRRRGFFYDKNTLDRILASFFMALFYLPNLKVLTSSMKSGDESSRIWLPNLPLDI